MLHYLRKTASVTLLLLLIGVGAGLVVFTASGGKLMSVQSGSMEPAIKKGGLVAVRQAETNSIKTGDVITYINPSDNTQTITHRVTGYRQSIMSGGKPHFITKGDANESADRPVPESAVVGKVLLDVPYAGHAINSLRTPVGLLLLVYLPAILIIAYETKRLSAYYRSIRPYSLRGSHGSADPIKTPLIMVVSAAAGLTLLFTAGPVFAALNSRVSLSGNTISSIPLTDKPEEPPIIDVKCNNSTDINIQSETNQNASSGNANASYNTGGGNAATGNAANQNSTNINIGTVNSCQNP